RLAHLARERSQVRARRRIESSAEGVPQALEQSSALADGLREKVGKDGLHGGGIALRATRTRPRGVLRHRFRARKPRLTRRTAVLVQWHAETLLPRKTMVKVTRPRPAAHCGDVPGVGAHGHPVAPGV